MTSPVFLRSLLAICLIMTGTVAYAAPDFAPVGAKAKLSVEYIYESAGKRRSEGLYDPYEWTVKRTASIAAEMAAQVSTALPSMQAMEAGQTATLNKKVEKSQAMAKQAAPMMMSMDKIMAKCGSDEACITREVMNLGGAMSGTPELETMKNLAKEAPGLADMGAMRYQAWQSKGESGSFVIEEKIHISVTDPICTSKPRHRCTRDETRKGAGEIPFYADMKKKGTAGGGISALEFDLAKNTITLRLPPPMLLPYIETIVTDEPEGTHDTPTPKGPVKKQLAYAVNADSGSTNDKPFTIPLKGGWRSQSGEQVVSVKGALENAGKLTIRWKFIAQ